MGVVNAFNLIDGLNGLSSYITVSVAVSLSIRLPSGTYTNFIFLDLIVAAVLGFWFFPWEKYLGDGGAHNVGTYSFGLRLFVNSATDVSAFAILLVFFNSEYWLGHLAPMEVGKPHRPPAASTSTSSPCGFRIDSWP